MALTARSITPKAAWYEAVHRLAHELGNCSGSVDDGILTVVTVDGRKSTQLGDLSPEGPTRILMGISN
jgi:hypothetical protein